MAVTGLAVYTSPSSAFNQSDLQPSDWNDFDFESLLSIRMLVFAQST